jgi:hypothetical protein
MYCADPEGVMDQEDAFLAALASTASYRLAGAQLELLDGTASVVLAFEPSAVPDTPTTAPATRTPAQPTPTAVPPTSAADLPKPTAEAAEAATPVSFQPPVGFRRYQDSATLYIVASSIAWIPVTVHIFARLYPIFYPEGFSITPLYRLIWYLSLHLSLLSMTYLMVESF